MTETTNRCWRCGSTDPAWMLSIAYDGTPFCPEVYHTAPTAEPGGLGSPSPGAESGVDLADSSEQWREPLARTVAEPAEEIARLTEPTP